MRRKARKGNFRAWEEWKSRFDVRTRTTQAQLSLFLVEFYFTFNCFLIIYSERGSTSAIEWVQIGEQICFPLFLIAFSISRRRARTLFFMALNDERTKTNSLK